MDHDGSLVDPVESVKAFIAKLDLHADDIVITEPPAGISVHESVDLKHKTGHIEITDHF